MKFFKERKKEEKPLLLTGYVEKTEKIDKQKKAQKKLEERAEMLYGEKTQEKKKELKPLFFNDLDLYEESEPEIVIEKKDKRVKKEVKGKETLKQKINKALDVAIYKTTDFMIEDGYKKTAQVGARLVGGIDADENLKMSNKDMYLSTPFALENKKYNSISEVAPFLRPFVIDKVKTQLGNEYLNTIKGLYVSNDKETSKRIAENVDIQLFVKKNKDFLKNFGFIKKDSIQFTDSNFYNAIGKADIIDMYLNPTGEITFYVLDTYDFNKNSDNPFVRAGRKHQEKGNLIPYFIIYSVKLDKYTVERLLR